MQVSSIFKIDGPSSTQGVTTCFVQARYITQGCRRSALDTFARRNRIDQTHNNLSVESFFSYILLPECSLAT